MMNTIVERKNWKSILLTSLMIIVVLSGVLVIFNYSSGITNYDKYDFLEGVLWVEASAKAKSLVSDSFVYSYIVLFGSNIFFMPFYFIFGTSLLTNQLGMLLFYIVYLLALYRLSKSLFDDSEKIEIFIIISNLFIYSYVGENLLRHILYYGMGYLCLISQLSCLINILNDNSTITNKILLFISFFIGAINGITVAFANVASLFAFLVVFLINKKDKSLIVKVITIAVVCTFLGLLTNVIFNSKALTTGGFSDRFAFATFSEMLRNISNIFPTYLYNFYKTTSLLEVNTVVGIAGYVYTFFGLSIFILAAASIKNYHNEKYQMLVLSSFVVMIVCLGEFILTDQSNTRYLFNITLSLFLLAAYEISSSNIKKRKYYLLITACLICLLGFRTVNSYSLNKQKLDEDMQICEILRENNLKYGFAKYITNYHVLSQGEIQGLTFSNYLKVQKFHCDYSLLNNKPDISEFFIIIEIDQYNDFICDNNLKDYAKKIEYGQFLIMVYSAEKWNYVINENLHN